MFLTQNMFRVLTNLTKKVILNESIRSCHKKDHSASNLKVTICGAAGETGQATALLLKNCPLIDLIGLYDVISTDGIALDVGFIDTKPKVASYKYKLKEALENTNIVVITAAAPRISTCDTEVMFNANAKILEELTMQIIQHCPHALITIATNPVNSIVPMVSEIFKKCRMYQPNKIFGVTSLDIVRANTFVADLKGMPPENISVPVIGGHSERTIVPIFSQTQPTFSFTNDELLQLTQDLQAFENPENVACSPTSSLPGAFAISRFVISLVRAMKGEPNVIECAYVHSNIYSDLEYLSTPVKLGIDGIQKNLGLPKMTDYEKCLLQTAYPFLKEDIERGNRYVGAEKKKIPEYDCEPSDCPKT